MCERLICVVALCALACGCAEERIVAVRGGLHGLPGAQSGLTDQAVSPGANRSVEEILASYRPEDPALVPIEGEPLRYRDPEGNVVIVSRSPQHVIYHITEMLRRGESELLFEQVISERAKRRYRSRFVDPIETVRFLEEHEDEVIDFFLLMPSGELTPGVRMTTPERGVIRLTPELGTKYTDSRFTTLELVIEEGDCLLSNIY